MIYIPFASEYFAPLLIFLIATILIYGALKKGGIPGTDFVLATISVLLSIIIVSSTNSVKYLFSAIPYLGIIIILTTFISISLLFVAGKDMFNKYLAWAGFGIAVIVLIFMAFSHFNSLNHMLPNSSNSGLTDAQEEFKDFIYQTQVKDTLLFLVLGGLVFFLLVQKVKK